MTLAMIQSGGVGVSIIDGKIYAPIMPPPNPTIWKVEAGPDGTIIFSDKDGGLILGAVSSEPLTQAEAISPRSTAAIRSWKVMLFSDDGESSTQLKDPSKMEDGFYTIEDPASGLCLSRYRIEDYSLNPKRVGLQPPQGGSNQLIIRVVG